MDALCGVVYVSALTRVSVNSTSLALSSHHQRPIFLFLPAFIFSLSFLETMGSSQSVLTPETALTVAVLAGAIGLGYTQLGPSSDSSPGVSSASKIPAKKGKKKKTQVPTSPSSDVSPSNPPPVPSVVPFPAVIPGGFDAAASAAEDLSSSKQSKGKKKKKSKPAASTTIPPAAAPVAAGYNSESSAGRLTPAKAKRQTEPALAPRSLKQSSVSIDTDGSWTRVESGRRVHGGAASASDAPSADLTTSDAGITTPVTGDSSPVLGRTEVEQEEAEGLEYSSRTAAGARRPLAERLLPKPRKTGVDECVFSAFFARGCGTERILEYSMLETPDHPTLARVMRVQPRPDEKPASGFSWGDYEDVRVAESAGAGNDADGEDEGWGVVRSKGRPSKSS